MKCIVISIGDELLNGYSVNTNSSFIGSEIFKTGISVEKIITIPDNRKIILNEFRKAWRQYDLVIVTGGLGPTEDDVTRKCISEFFKLPLVTSRKLRSHIRKLFSRRGIKPAKAVYSQSLIPKRSLILPNPIGTSAGILIRQKNKIFCSMPGVPAELKHIFNNSFLPYLNKKLNRKSDTVIINRTFNTIGLPETVIYEMLKAEQKNLLSDRSAHVSFAYLPSAYEVKLRVTIKAKHKTDAKRLMNKVTGFIYTNIGRYVYSTSEETIQEVIAEILKRENYTLSVAESCTGGLIASRITDVPGSSGFFAGGVVAYSNDLKTSLLGVRKTTLKKYGAVSKQVAEEMAIGMRKVSGSDIAVSTTGIAGPSGATAGKPVGLVWIAFADRNNCYSQKFIFSKDRIKNKEMMSKAALDLIRRKLSNIS